MRHWIRYEHQRKTGFGRLEGEFIRPCEGTVFAPNLVDCEPILLSEVNPLIPIVPTKMIALWNNYRALAKIKKLSHPKTPLYIIKPPNSYLATGQRIRRPPGYEGDVFFEGELGIVIGRHASRVPVSQVKDCIFGYTCINDVTAFSLLKEEQGFDQWTRAKGFDTFGSFGPVIAQTTSVKGLRVVTRVNGKQVQNYPVSDMILPPEVIVSELSHDMSLCPGDVICVGTSVGLGAMPDGCEVEVRINGIGSLRNTF